MKKYILTSIILLLAAVNTAWGQNVAKIGTIEYATLAEAFTAANAAGNCTITLLADIDFSQSPYDVYKWAGSTYNPLEITNSNITIDLNGKTISNMGNTAIVLGHLLARDGRISNVTIKNGKLSAGQTDGVTNSYVLGIAGVDGVSIKDVTTIGGINVYTGSTDVVIEDCNVTGTKYYTVCSQSGSQVTIKGTTYTKNTDNTVANKSMFWVQGAGTDSDMQTTANPTGAFDASTITIESGNFTVDTTNGGKFFLSGSGNVTPTVKGGTYNIDPSNIQSTNCVAPGYSSKDNGDGTYGVISDYEAKIGDTKYETLEAAISDAQAGQTIELLKNIDLGSSYYQIINKAVTIDGGDDQYEIKGTGTGSETNTDATIVLQGTGDVTLKNLKVTNTTNNGVQMKGLSYSGKLTIEDCEINVAKRGINVSCPDTGFELIVKGTTIKSNLDDPTTTYTTGNDSRGLSLWTENSNNAAVNYNATLTNCTIEGFSYDINSDGSGTVNLTMTGGTTYGRAAVNNWTSNSTFTLDGVEIHGLNNQTGPTEAFACIVDNEDAENNIYNINDCKFYVALSCDAVYASESTASEQMFALRGTNATVNITGSTTYTDQSECTDDSRVGLLEDENQVAEESNNNTINFDADAVTSLASVIGDLEDLSAINTGTGNYTLGTAVAEVVETGTKYSTLQAAIAAATSGQTVKILAQEITDAGRINLPAGVTLEGDANILSGNSCVYINAAGGTVQNVYFDGIHNEQNKLSAIYAPNLTGEAIITGCYFSNCDWDAIQITPKAGAEITITENCFDDDDTFDNNNIKQQRYIHIQSAQNVDFSATIHDNILYGTLAQEPMGVYYPTDRSKVNINNNYIEDINGVCILMNDGEIAGELVFPTYNTDDPDDGTWSPVAKIDKDAYTSNYYKSLKAAVAAAQAGDVITMIADDDVSLTDGSEIEINKPITITGAVDADGKPLYTIYGKSNATSNYHDVFVNSASGTVTISNVKFANFKNAIASANGNAPIFVGISNNNVVIDNVNISNINCEGIHINGGTFTIQNSYIDCAKESGFTRGVQITNAASGSITNTTIVNTTGTANVCTAAVEAIGSGAIEVTNCTFTTTTENSAGIATSDAESTSAGSSVITVSGCTITAENPLFNDSSEGAKINVSSGMYNGVLYDTGNPVALSISGGNFSVPVPEAYCADGYIPTDADPATGLYTVKSGAYVAEVFNNEYASIGKYETLAEAFAAANAAEGSTLTLLTDVNVTNDDLNGVTDIPPYLVTGDFTLDLDGNKITYTGTSTLSTGIIGVKRGGNLTVDDASTPSTGEINSGSKAYAAIAVTVKGEAATGDAATLTVESGTIIGDYYAITGNGSRHNTEITINGGVIQGSHEGDNLGIYHPQNGTLIITGGEITGYSSAIEVRSGKLNVTGGTFETTATSYSCNPNGSGTTTVGAAIAIAQHTTNQPIDATISGGTFTIPSTGNAVKLSVSNPQNNSFSNVSVSGLTALIGESNKIPDGYMWVEANGISTLSKAVAKIGNVNYATLQAAINAAVTASITASGEEIIVELLKDVTDGTGLALFNTAKGDYPAANGANVKIDFGGHTYKVAGPAVGSTNTQNQVLHFEEGNTITLTNGTINMTDDATALAGFEMFMQNYGTLIIDGMTIDGTGIAVATYASSYGTPWGGTAKPQFNYNTAGNSVIRNSTITMTGDLGIDDSAALTIEDDAVINVNKIVTKGTDDRYASATPTLTVENGAQFKLADADGVTAFEALLNTMGQTLGTAVNGVYTVASTIYVASITASGTTTNYTTLAEAIAAVQDGEIIKLYADITLTDDIACTLASGSTFTIDFNNHNVIRNGNHVVLAEGVSILTNVAASQLFAAEGDNVVVESNSGNTDYPYKYSVKKSIANAGITISVNSATYTGALQTPTVTVKDGNNVLEAGTHYTISYKGSELKNANTYVEEIIITGIGDYAGTKTADFTINKRNINDVTVEGHSQTYTTSGYTTSQIEGLIKLKYNDIPLVVSTDYTIAVDDTKTYKDSGTYPEVITLTAVPGGNFEGSRKVNFYIGGAKDITTSNIIATVVYNGSAQVPSEATVTVKDGNTNQPLTLGTDFTLEYFQNYEYINAQTYVNAITIVGIGTYYGTKTVDYIITPKDISGCIINNSTPFTGAVIDPATVVTVKDGNTTLSSTDDYTLTVSQGHTYQNPQTYANAITITGKGNYTGTKTMDFIITQTDAINLATAAVVISKQTYTGADLKPTAATTTVTVNGAALDPANYTFSFVPEGDNFYKDAKVYSNAIIITASTTQSTYYGTVVGNYIIEPRDLSDNGITVTATDLDYNANGQDVTVQDVTVTVKYGNNVIPATNYTIDPTKVTEAGTYNITVNAVENSNLVGSTTTTLLVKKALDGTYATDFSVDPSSIPTQTATGSQITPTIVLKDKDRVMTPNVDYTVSYGTNTDEGEGTITITGTGAYSGTKEITFTIVNEYFTVDNITYHHANEGENVAVGNNHLLATTKTGKVEVGNTVTYTIPNTNISKTFTVTGVEQNAFSSNEITGIVLPQSIAEIEDNAFQGAINTRYVDASAMSGYVPETLTRDFDGPFGGLPKQALVYLTGTNIKGENYVYKPGSGDAYYCELFKIYDDLNGSQTGFDGNDYKWAFENVHKFTAYTVENTRMLTAGKHYTTCLPYSIDIPRNVKAYTLDATSGNIFGFKEIPGSTIEAYTPYVLIPSTSGQLLSATDVEVDVFTEDADGTESKLNPTQKGNFTFYGTMRYMEGDAAAGKYIMQYKDNKSTWLSIDEGSAGFTNTDNRACILPMRAYIASTGSGARSYTATFTDIDGIIRTETFTLDDEDTVIYDLSGRRVELLEHGHTYIINGKKVIAK